MNDGVPPTSSFLGRLTARILRPFRRKLEKPEDTIAHAVDEAFAGFAREFRV